MSKLNIVICNLKHTRLEAIKRAAAEAKAAGITTSDTPRIQMPVVNLGHKDKSVPKSSLKLQRWMVDEDWLRAQRGVTLCLENDPEDFLDAVFEHGNLQ